jgi:hypothetical protein
MAQPPPPPSDAHHPPPTLLGRFLTGAAPAHSAPVSIGRSAPAPASVKAATPPSPVSHPEM